MITFPYVNLLEKTNKFLQFAQIRKLTQGVFWKYCFGSLTINLRRILPLKITNPFPGWHLPVQISKRITRIRCKICSKLTIMTPERHQWCRSSVFLLFTLKMFHILLWCLYCWPWTGKCWLSSTKCFYQISYFLHSLHIPSQRISRTSPQLRNCFKKENYSNY